jgi:hypothetical protein
MGSSWKGFEFGESLGLREGRDVGALSISLENIEKILLKI